jgi:hypothetical protein
MKISGYINQYKTDRADAQAFKKRTSLARREAYRKEAIKVAEERGRRSARTKGFSEILFPNAYRKSPSKIKHRPKEKYDYKKVKIRR